MPNQQITLYFSKFQQALVDIPVIVGNEVVNYTLESFDEQEWDGLPWQKRKSKKDQGRALLVKSGTLRRSIRVISSTANTVTVGTDVIYAGVHNEGGLITRAARSETFIRPRYATGRKGKMFGGMGAFRKMTKEELSAAPVKGQTYKAYSYSMPRRQFLGYTPQLGERIQAAVSKRIKEVTQS